jgi:hypothetical protein
MALEHRLAEEVAALSAALAEPLGGVDDERLRELIGMVGSVRRLVDAAGVRIAGEVARRCEEGALAARWGERSAAAVVAAEAGIDPSEAQDWCEVGAQAVPRFSLAGEELVPRDPAIAAAVERAQLTTRTLGRIVRAVDEIDRRAPGRGEAIAPTLLAEARHLAPRELARLCRFAIDRADADGVPVREEELRRRSGVQVLHLPDGMLRWIITMDPESAGFLTAALDARTAPRREPRFATADHDPAEHDERTLARRRLDALVSIARESLRHDPGDVAGTAVTMLVTVSLDSLRTGLGAAEISGVDAPISAATARRLAAQAEIVPVVLGGASEPLDLGRSARLFSASQRRALALRDGGCVWWGCTAPPGWCEIAHVDPWARGGPTDLGNAILLCPFHHRRFDLDGWALQVVDGERWLIPPSWVDARRTPRRAGRARSVAA